MPTDQAPHAQLLERKLAALVVLDLQAKLVPAIFEAQRVIRNTQLLLLQAQILEIPIVLTSHYTKGLGGIIPEIAQSAAGIVPIEKTSFGCFGEPDFLRQLKLRAPEARSLLIAGVESHICVMQTALGAMQAGYLVYVTADATSSRTEDNWKIGLNRMEHAGAVISSTEMMVYELLAKSATPEFRAILPLLK